MISQIMISTSDGSDGLPEIRRKSVEVNPDAVLDPPDLPFTGTSDSKIPKATLPSQTQEKTVFNQVIKKRKRL